MSSGEEGDYTEGTTPESEEDDTVAIIFLYVAVFIVYFFVKTCIKVVHHAEVMIVERFGKFHVRISTPTLLVTL